MLELNIRLHRANFDMAVQCVLGCRATGLFGPSGSGKSSLLSCLAGLSTVDSGRIVLNDRVLFDSEQRVNVPAHRRRIGMVFQDSLLLPHLTVKANLTYGMPRVDRRHSVMSIAEILGVTHLLDARPGDLSGGERQRVALGRTVLSQPDLILLDEPFNGLDKARKNGLLPFVQALYMHTGVPILLVSHELAVIQYLTDEVLLMDHGRLMGQGAVHELALQASGHRLLGTQALNNIFEVVMTDHDLCTGMTLYSVRAQLSSGEPSRLRIKLKGLHQPEHRPGQAYSVSLPSRNIALALAPVDYISMQNQMPGTITDIADLPGRSVATVDVGIKLLVEITEQTIRDLGLHMGQKIWCLFKASSLELVAKTLTGSPGDTTEARHRDCTGVAVRGPSERGLSHTHPARYGR